MNNKNKSIIEKAMDLVNAVPEGYEPPEEIEHIVGCLIDLYHALPSPGDDTVICSVAGQVAGMVSSAEGSVHHGLYIFSCILRYVTDEDLPGVEAPIQ